MNLGQAKEPADSVSAFETEPSSPKRRKRRKETLDQTMQRCLCVPPKAVSCSGKGWKVLCLFLLEFYAFADKTLCLNLLLLS